MGQFVFEAVWDKVTNTIKQRHRPGKHAMFLLDQEALG